MSYKKYSRKITFYDFYQDLNSLLNWFNKFKIWSLFYVFNNNKKVIKVNIL